MNLQKQVVDGSEPELVRAFVDVTTQTGLEGRAQWFAIQTRHRHEKRVAEQLKQKTVAAYLPIERCKHRWKNGVNAELELPLFPGYLFARVTSDERVSVLQLPGVVGFAVSTSRPTAIPDNEIETLRTAVEMMKAEPHPFLSVGDRVRITAGPLHGMEGIMVRRRSGVGVVINVDLIMRSIVVEVSGNDIERVFR